MTPLAGVFGRPQRGSWCVHKGLWAPLNCRAVSASGQSHSFRGLARGKAFFFSSLHPHLAFTSLGKWGWAAQQTVVCIVSQILTCPWNSGLFLSVRRDKVWCISPLLKFSTLLQALNQLSVLEFCVNGMLPSVRPYVFNQSSIDYGFEIHS